MFLLEVVNERKDVFSLSFLLKSCSESITEIEKA